MLNLGTTVEAYSSDQVEVKQSMVVLRIYLTDRENNVENGLEASVYKGPMLLSPSIQVTSKPD